MRHPKTSMIHLASFVILAAISVQEGRSENPPPPEDLLGCWKGKQDLFAQAPLRDGPPIPPTNYDVLHYDLHIDVDFNDESISGAVEITARSLVEALGVMEVDLRENMVIDGISQESTDLDFHHLGDRIVIRLDPVIGLDETFTVQITYHGQPIAEWFVPFQFRDHQGVPIAATLSEPWFARNWWPCKEDLTDKATADIAFTVPDSMIAASNGLLTEVVDHDTTKTYRWSTSYPIVTYLISGAMTNYIHFTDEYELIEGGSMPLDYYVYPEELETALDVFTIVPDMLEYFAGVYGEYPFAAEKYGLALFESSGMEHQTLSSVGVCCYEGSPLLSHETAHQWWGDLVTCATWHDAWLNEGFASFSAALWNGVENPPGGYIEFLRMLDNSPDGWDGSVYRTSINNVLEIFDVIIYSKGAWVLHMLRGILGDEDFFGSLLAYRDAFAYDSATTEDLKSSFETHTGIDLDWFFEEWVYGEHRPDYEYLWFADHPEPGLMTLQIDQVQTNAPAFKMPIEIDVVTDLGTERFTVWDSLTSQQFVLPIEGDILDVVFDPDDWILEWHRLGTPDQVDESASHDLDAPRIDRVAPVPSGGATTIVFTLPELGNRPSDPVQLAIYDVRGRLVRNLPIDDAKPGRHSIVWDGRTDAGHQVSQGVYSVRLTALGTSVSQRVALVR